VKASIRWWSRLAFVTGLGLSAAVVGACSSDHADGHGDEQRNGTLSLALQSTAPSGNVYRLRGALFQITNVRSGDNVQFLSSEDGLPQEQELTALLMTGDYTVTLLPGWFLERVGSSGGGGDAGAGPITSAGAGPITFPPGSAGASDEGSAAGQGGAFGGVAGSFAAGGSFGTAGTFASGGTFASSGAPSGGTFPGGGTSPVGNGPVDAHLLNDAVQFFSLRGGDDAFVSYQFQVGGEVIDFTKGKLHVGFTVDDSAACLPPDDAIMPERVLLESNVDAVANISLFAALSALASNGGRTDDPQLIYQEIYDSYSSADQARLPDAIHCGDEQTDGQPTLNGYPIECNRFEAQEIDNLGSFFATAFVNRMDLAPTNGAHCGQQRIIFANNSIGRAFMILEAQIPNPTPELGIDGCRPLAQFWLDQNAIGDPVERGRRLAEAFTVGSPELTKFGFGPFLTAENLTVGSGQIRTNQFVSFPWTLREFKLALDGEQLKAVPFPVSESPNGGLWNEASGLPQGEACRQNFLGAIDGVLTNDLSQMSFVVDSACKDAESRNDFGEDYASQLSPGFRSQLESKLLGTGLTPDDAANRAQFAGSCIGCHNEASSKFLGDGVFAPFSVDFPQVQEFASQCTGGEQGNCFLTSNALQGTFLPGRLQVMGLLLDVPIVTNPCTGGGVGGSSSGGSSGIPTAGSFGMGTAGSGVSSPSIPPDGDPLPVGDTDPAPVVDIELPAADEPIIELQQQDAEIRAAYGEQTLSGRSAKVTH
jgi:hypothetical protein